LYYTIRIGYPTPTNSAQIVRLLDLKQKQANAWEARISREGAEETASQGNVRVECLSPCAAHLFTMLFLDPPSVHRCDYYLCKLRLPFLDTAESCERHLCSNSSHCRLWRPSLRLQ
jgi:hypothetical protein